MNDLKELEKRIEAAREELVAAEAALAAAKQSTEWPQMGEEYWVGAENSHGAWSSSYADDKTDAFRKAIGDMHRTKEEAEAYRAYRMNPRTVMRDKIQMWLEEYNCGQQGRYVMHKSGSAVEAVAANSFAIKDMTGVGIMIEKFGLDNILWACGGPEPGVE